MSVFIQHNNSARKSSSPCPFHREKELRPNTTDPPGVFGSSIEIVCELIFSIFPLSIGYLCLSDSSNYEPWKADCFNLPQNLSQCLKHHNCCD